jgi:segregation and condensation protein B
MSLKAKLEAVIYAAEEPVTLAQLAALFAAEALEWKAEQEAASAEQAAEAAQNLPLDLSEDPAYAELEPVEVEPSEATTIPTEAAEAPASEVSPEAAPESAQEPTPEAAPETNPEANSETNPEAAPETTPDADADPAAPAPTEEEAANAADADEAEARRVARQRDREIRAILRQLLDELIASYASDNRGIEIREIAGGFRVATKPECHDAVRLFVRSLKPALKLSLPALETLAVVAYKQPVTAPEVNEIRGVDSSGVFGSLLARKLIATAGRKQVIGRPILYKTTREFLLRFGLKDVTELPSMEEFEKLAALELEEPEPTAEEDGEQKPNPALAPEGPEFDEAASEKLEDSPIEDIQLQAAPSEPTETAETAVSNEPTPPEEAAPAAPPAPEQAENETLPHGEEKS